MVLAAHFINAVESQLLKKVLRFLLNLCLYIINANKKWEIPSEKILVKLYHCLLELLIIVMAFHS